MIKKAFLLVLFVACGVAVSAQSYSLRTNILGLATANLNLEASMTLDRKWSLHLPLQYNPFKFSKNRQFRNFYASPGVRYWLLESYMGGFIGMHGTAGTYSVGNLFGSKYRYEGEGYGVGISIGRAYQLGRRWNLEWEIGAGAVWLAFSSYPRRTEHGLPFLIFPTDEKYKTYHTLRVALGTACLMCYRPQAGTCTHFPASNERSGRRYGIPPAPADNMDG